MKREIKFRCWCRDGEWEESGEKMKFTMIDADSLCFNLCIPLKDQLTDVEDEQYFMQYTGMKDKNGKEIYDGDIIGDWTEVDGKMEQSKMQVYFDEMLGQWMLDCSLKQDRSMSYSLFKELEDFEYEVIGNIFENQQLVSEAG